MYDEIKKIKEKIESRIAGIKNMFMSSRAIGLAEALEIVEQVEKEQLDTPCNSNDTVSRSNVAVTNGDKIRQMSNEELAEWIKELNGRDLCDFCIVEDYPCYSEDGKCKRNILAYLNKGVNE